MDDRISDFDFFSSSGENSSVFRVTIAGLFLLISIRNLKNNRHEKQIFDFNKKQ